MNNNDWLVILTAVIWLNYVLLHSKPPWSLSKEEFYTEVKRGGYYTYYGLEYARDWWLRILFVVVVIGFFAFMYMVNCV
jgi:hypothetical protein